MMHSFTYLYLWPLTSVSSGEGWAAGRGSYLATPTASGPIAARWGRNLEGRSFLGSWRTQKLLTMLTCHLTPPTSFLTPPSSPLTPPTSTPPSPRISGWQVDWPMGRGTRCWLDVSLLRGQSSTCWSGRGQHHIRTFTEKQGLDVLWSFDSSSSTQSTPDQLPVKSVCWLVRTTQLS